MKINLSVKKEIVLTVKQQKYIEKRLNKLDRFLKNRDQALVVDLSMNDETNGAKGGVDKNVSITVQIPGEQAPLHISDREDKIMRAFNLAIDKVERKLREDHRRLVGQTRTGGRFDKLLKIIGRRK